MTSETRPAEPEKHIVKYGEHIPHIVTYKGRIITLGGLTAEEVPLDHPEPVIYLGLKRVGYSERGGFLFGLTYDSTAALERFSHKLDDHSKSRCRSKFLNRLRTHHGFRALSVISPAAQNRCLKFQEALPEVWRPSVRRIDYIIDAALEYVDRYLPYSVRVFPVSQLSDDQRRIVDHRAALLSRYLGLNILLESLVSAVFELLGLFIKKA